MDTADGAIGRISAKIFEDWNEFEAFERDVQRFCWTLAARAGLAANVDSDLLSAIHLDWIRECSHWCESTKMPDGTIELSHHKTLAILLRSMTEKEFVKFSDSAQNLDDVYGSLDINGPLKKAVMLDGQHYYLAWVFIHQIAVWFEQNRDDRQTKFESRITEEFETDLVSMLISGSHTSDSLYIVLLALFLRD